MTYNEIIQTAGRRFKKKLYYYVKGSNNPVDISDNFERAKIGFKAKLTGTTMYYAEIETTVAIPSNAEIYLQVCASTGTFTVDSPNVKYGAFYIKDGGYQADTKTYVYECYDAMLFTMVDYVPVGGQYPCDLDTFLQRIINVLNNKVNATLVFNDTLANADVSIEKDYFSGIEGITYRDVLDDIFEANGVNVYFNSPLGDEDYPRNRIISLTCLRPKLGTEKTITDDILKNQNIEFGEEYGPINTIVLSRSNDTDNIYYPETLPANPIEFKIKDNYLLNDNNRSNYIEGIYNQLQGIKFNLYDLELTGYGILEPMSKLQFQTGNNTYHSNLFNWECEITSGYTESIYAERPEEEVTEYKYASTTDKALKGAYMIIDKQSGEISQVASKVETLDGKVTTNTASISTNASNISAEVTRATGEESTIKGLIELKISKDDYNQIVSMINLASSIITLSSDRLVIDSTNFKLTADGTMTANNGTFKGTLNTSADCTVGNNIYVGQNQITTSADSKFIKFSENTWVNRFYLNGTEGLRLKGQNGMETNCTDRGTCSLNSTNDVWVPFNKTFPNVPTVVLTCCDSSAYGYAGVAHGVTTTGFYAFIGWITNNPYKTANYSWIATCVN